MFTGRSRMMSMGLAAIAGMMGRAVQSSNMDPTSGPAPEPERRPANHDSSIVRRARRAMKRYYAKQTPADTLALHKAHEKRMRKNNKRIRDAFAAAQ